MPTIRPLIAAAAAILVLACGRDDSVRVEPVVGMENGVRAAFDPTDESRFLIVEKAGAIVAWTRKDGINRRALTIRTDAVDAIFDDGAIVSIHPDGSVRRWRFDGTRIAEGRPEGASRPTAIVSLGDRIVSADESGRIHVWTRKLDAHTSIEPHKGEVIALAADPARNAVVSVGKDKHVLVWRLADGALTRMFSPTFDGEPLAAAVATDGVLAIGGRANEHGTVALIDLPHGARPLRRIELPQAVTSLSFSGLTGVLATNGDRGPVAINRDGSIRPMQGSSDGADVVAFSARSDLLLALTPASVALYSMGGELVSTRKLAMHTDLPPRPPPGQARARPRDIVRPFGDGFVAATAGGDVTFTDAGGNPIRQLVLRDVAGFVALGVSDAKGFVAVLTDNGKAWLCRAAGEPVLLDAQSVHDLAVSPSGLVALQYSDLSIVIRNLDDPQADARPLLTDAALVTGMAFVKDDDLALLHGQSIKLVPLRDGPGGRFDLDHEFDRIAVSPDGALLALGAADGFLELCDPSGVTLRIWQPADLTIRTAPVADLAFSSRENLLASTHTGEGVVRLWDVRQGMEGAPRAQQLSPQPDSRSGRSFHHLSAAFARSTDRLLTLDERGEAASYALGLTPLSGGELRETSFGTAAVAPDGSEIVTVERGKAWAWKVDPDTGVTSTAREVAADNLHPITDVAYARNGKLLFAATDWLGPVMAWRSDIGWESGIITAANNPVMDAVPESNLATTQTEAVFVQGGALRWWTPGQKAVATPTVDANDARVAFIPGKIDAVALGWEPEKDHGMVAVVSRTGLTWTQETASGVIAIAAPADRDAEMFATASQKADVTLWRKAPGDRWRWSEAYTLPTSDGTKAHALAFGSGGRLLVGTDGGTIEWRDRDGNRLSSVPLGNSIKRLGIAPRRIWAVLGSRQIVFLSDGLELKATMTPTGGEAILSTPEERYSGKGSGANFYRGASFEPLPESKITPMDSVSEVTASMTGRSDRWRRLRDFFSNAAPKMLAAIQAMSGKDKTAFLLGCALVVFLFLSTIWILAPHWLAEWAMGTIRPKPQVLSFDWIPKQLQMLNGFGHKQRAVDRWFARALAAPKALGALRALTSRKPRVAPKTLREQCFTDLTCVKERSRYDDRGHEDVFHRWREAIENCEPKGLWIVGPDGSGKSTLAFKLAGATPPSSPPLPVVVHKDWEGSLVDSIRLQMNVAGRRPTKEMLEDLASRGQIVLVVDGLSERQATAEDQVFDAWKTDRTFVFMIVTSCKEPREDLDMEVVRMNARSLEPAAAPITSPSPPATSIPPPPV
jgi:WD40 repeat protein